MKLSVVVPCLNESDTVAKCVTTALATMAKIDIEGEIIVADKREHRRISGNRGRGWGKNRNGAATRIRERADGRHPLGEGKRSGFSLLLPQKRRVFAVFSRSPSNESSPCRTSALFGLARPAGTA